MTDRPRPPTRRARDPSPGDRRRPPSPDPASRPDRREGQGAAAIASRSTGGRWFLACWPDAATRRALQRKQAAWAWPPGARPTPPARLHLTLHFIGALPDAAVPALRHALDTVDAATPANWTLTLIEIWRGGVAALVPAQVPGAAAALHAALADVLRREKLPVEPRPWRPHVTLARRARGATATGADATSPVHWTSTGFELVRSDHGYHRSGRWPRSAGGRD